MTATPHIGSSLDKLLEEEGILAEVSAILRRRGYAITIKRVLA